MKQSATRFALPFLVLLAGCTSQPQPAPMMAEPAPPPAPVTVVVSSAALPGSYIGQLPCADCSGIKYQVDLLSDGSFTSRMTYLGRGPETTVDDLGRWARSTDQMTLTLQGQNAQPGGQGFVRLAVKGADTLRLLDQQGMEVVSPTMADLARVDRATPIEPHLKLSGLYRPLAGVGLFTECVTGHRLTVARGADAGLAAAYSRLRPKAGDPVKMEVTGTVAESSLAVDKVAGGWPGETCGTAFTAAPLEGTSWKLTRLDSGPVVGAPREAGLTLTPAGRRVSGSTGCNQLAGGYRLDGSAISFTQAASTRMACVQGGEGEAKFLRALERVRLWQVSGPFLSFSDSRGREVMRFEARAR